MDCIISIELGTNAVRIYAFDMQGNVIGFAKGAYPTFHPDPDHSEQDPEQIFITMLYILKNLLSEKIHPQKHKVLCICFSGAMHSVLAIDRNGVPLGNAITWADNRGKKEAQALKNSPLGEKIYHATGTPIHPMSPLVKIAWMKSHDKERFKLTWKFLSIKSYIIQQLADGYVTDYSLASATGLLNIHKKDWEPDSLKYAGITADKLPELVSVFHAENKLRKEYQTLLGLSARTKIIVGSSDGCLAMLGSGAWKKDKATITIEDSGAMRVIGKQILQDKKQRFFNYILTDDYYVSGGPTNNGGVVFEWFARQFGDFKNAFDIESSMEELIQEAAKVATGSDGLLFLPYLLGERAPIWNANARGVYFGLNINHERKHLIRATIEGILYEVYSISKTLEEHRTINSVTVNGSFASIPFCTQLIADILNKPVSISKNTNSVGLGAFLLSATEMNIYKNLDEAAQTVVLPDTYKPNKQNHSVYKKHIVIFENLSTKLSDEFGAIANLQ
jgi:gluconokinase